MERLHEKAWLASAAVVREARPRLEALVDGRKPKQRDHFLHTLLREDAFKADCLHPVDGHADQVLARLSALGWNATSSGAYVMAPADDMDGEWCTWDDCTEYIGSGYTVFLSFDPGRLGYLELEEGRTVDRYIVRP